MDNYGLTDLEKNYHLEEYNHALFDNMKAFMDSCWEVNLATNTVVMLHETMKPEYIGREFDYYRVLFEYGEHYVYPLDRKNWYKLFSVSALFELTQETIVDIHMIGTSTSIPEVCRFILTPAGDNESGIKRVYISSKNMESDIKVLREMQEEKQIIFAAMGATYPIIVYSNISCNSYMIYMLTDHKMDLPIGGTYDSFVKIVSESILSKYREDFVKVFERENIERELHADGQFVEFEYEQNMEGTTHWLSAKTVRINNPYNSDFMAITLISIIDEQRNNEYVAKMALQDAYNAALDAEKTKSEFLSRMSHEMLTPLNTVQGLVTLGMSDSSLTDEQRHIFEQIGKAGERLNEQLSRLLDTSLLETETITLTEAPTELTTELTRVIDQIKESAFEKNIQLDISCSDLVHNEVICDSTRIMQVFGALLSNAVKFTDEGGTVSAVLKEGKGRRSGFGFYKFIVKDNGIGISDEYKERIFEPFERVEDNRVSRNSGSGLGLYIVRNITKLLGGNITVESEYGKGSEFTATFFLKLCTSMRGTDTDADLLFDPEEIEKLSFKGKRILVVEDNELNNEIISAILQEMDFEVENAYDGKEAVSTVLASEPGHFDIVLMDIMMPILDGYEASAEIRRSDREDLKTLPIIAASANSYPADIERSLSSGMNDHIAKPIEAVSLANVLKHWLK